MNKTNYYINTLRFLGIVAVLFLGTVVQAQVVNPFVTSLTVSPSTVANATAVTITWQAAGANGANLYLTCPIGVSFKTSSGSTVSCGSAIATGPYASGAFDYVAYNASGITQTVSARLVPKNEYGAETISGARTTTFTVYPSGQPITDFSASTLSPKSGDTITLTWVGYYIDGVNLKFSCSDSLKLWNTASTPAELLCDTLISSTPLATSGSYKFKVVNSSYSSAALSVFVIPSQGGGYYDATKALSLSLTVGGNIVSPNALVQEASTSKSIVSSKESFTLSWNIANASGANLQFTCNPAFSFFSVDGTTTTPLTCGVAAFQEGLSAKGTQTVMIENTGYSTQKATILVLPQRSDKTYTTYEAGTISVSVRESSYVPPLVSTPPTTQVSISKTTTPTITSSLKPATLLFTLPLTLGSKGTQVTALQNFLAQDTALYPEKIVSGYFGSLTEKAVQRFQIRFGITSPGDVGYGFVGPKTRTFLNSFAHSQ